MTTVWSPEAERSDFESLDQLRSKIALSWAVHSNSLNFEEEGVEREIHPSSSATAINLLHGEYLTAKGGRGYSLPPFRKATLLSNCL